VLWRSSPNPDDLEYGAASAVARWTSQGKTVLLRPGHQRRSRHRRPGGPMSPSLYGEAEQRRSAAVVGLMTFEFLGYPTVPSSTACNCVGTWRGPASCPPPTSVIGMNFRSDWGEGGSVNHSDHRAVGLGLPSMHVEMQPTNGSSRNW